MSPDFWLFYCAFPYVLQATTTVYPFIEQRQDKRINNSTLFKNQIYFPLLRCIEFLWWSVKKIMCLHSSSVHPLHKHIYLAKGHKTLEWNWNFTINEFGFISFYLFLLFYLFFYGWLFVFFTGEWLLKRDKNWWIV